MLFNYLKKDLINSSAFCNGTCISQWFKSARFLKSLPFVFLDKRVLCGKKMVCAGGGYFYFRVDIILIKGLSKHMVTWLLPSMAIDSKHAYLICMLETMVKIHPPPPPLLYLFYPPLNDVCTNIAWSWKTTLHCNYMIFFLQGLYPTSNISAQLSQEVCMPDPVLHNDVVIYTNQVVTFKLCVAAKSVKIKTITKISTFHKFTYMYKIFIPCQIAVYSIDIQHWHSYLIKYLIDVIE